MGDDSPSALQFRDRGALAPGQRAQRSPGSHAPCGPVTQQGNRGRKCPSLASEECRPPVHLMERDWGCRRSGYSETEDTQVWGAHSGVAEDRCGCCGFPASLSPTPTSGMLGFGARRLAQATAGQAQLSLPRGEELCKQEVHCPDADVPLIRAESSGVSFSQRVSLSV